MDLKIKLDYRVLELELSGIPEGIGGILLLVGLGLVVRQWMVRTNKD